MDDIYVVCDPEQCANLLEYITKVLWDMCRININLGKLVVWGTTPAPCPTDPYERAPGAWRSDKPLAERGMKILGAPFGAAEYIGTFGG